MTSEVRREHEDGQAAVRGRAGMGWTDRHQGAGSGVDGGRTRGAERGLTGPASSKHTCREGLCRLHGLGDLAGEVASRQRDSRGGLVAWWPHSVPMSMQRHAATDNCRAVSSFALRKTCHAGKVELTGSCVVMADCCACLSKAAPRDFLGLLGRWARNVLQEVLPCMK